MVLTAVATVVWRTVTTLVVGTVMTVTEVDCTVEVVSTVTVSGWIVVELTNTVLVTGFTAATAVAGTETTVTVVVTSTAKDGVDNVQRYLGH